MHRIARFLAPLIAASAIALAGGSQALAASDSAASPSSISIDNSFCYTSGALTSCFDISGQAHFLDTSVGSSVTMTRTTVTTYYENGVQTGGARSESVYRGTVADDGTVTTQSVVHTRTVDGDGTCTYRLVLRLVEYEPVVAIDELSCGG
jgi:hypothetical protein